MVFKYKETFYLNILKYKQQSKKSKINLWQKPN